MASLAWPSTKSQFKNRFPNYTSAFVDNLDINRSQHSSSSWNHEHLYACRVLISRPPGGLNALLAKYNSSETVQQFLQDNVAEELASISERQLKQETRWSLRQKGGIWASFFALLAALIEVRQSSNPPSTPTTPRNTRRQPNASFVSGENLSLSSPLNSSPPVAQVPPSSSPYQPSEHNSVDEDLHQDRKKKEIVTLTMVAEFISVIVDLYAESSAVKGLNNAPRLVFNAAPSSYTIRNKALECTCLDDGSITWQIMNSAGEWTTTDQSASSLIEVKPIVKS